MLDREVKSVLLQLGNHAFAPLGCKRYGIAMRNDATYDRLLEKAGISQEFGCQFQLKHDWAGAPLLVDASGTEQLPFISLTDEDDSKAIAWVDPRQGERIVGVGIDLANRGDFPFTEKLVGSYRRIFTETEMSCIETMCPSDLDLGATLLFSAKEATFKAASQQIRKLFRACGEDENEFGCPYFELRDIEVLAVQPPSRVEAQAACAPTVLGGAWRARGIHRIGDAAAAFEFLGIERVSIGFALLGGKVLSVAVAQHSAALHGNAVEKPPHQ